MFNKRFEATDEVPGSMVTVYYLPWEQEYILVGPDKTFVKALDAVNNALRFDKPVRGNAPDNNKENHQ